MITTIQWGENNILIPEIYETNLLHNIHGKKRNSIKHIHSVQ